jgi:hypothetical protein
VRVLTQALKDEKKDAETMRLKLDSDYKLALVTETQKIRDAAQAEITKYRDDLTTQLRTEMDELRKSLAASAIEKKPQGRPRQTSKE